MNINVHLFFFGSKGDSGSGLLVSSPNKQNKLIVVGIVSFGSLGVNKKTKKLAVCTAGTLTYFIKVQPYIDWMKTVTDKQLCLI